MTTARLIRHTSVENEWFLVVAGHILRRTDNYRTTRIKEWIPRDGKCSIGRQKVRWGNKTKKFTGIIRNQLVQDRTNWRPLGKALVLQWT